MPQEEQVNPEPTKDTKEVQNESHEEEVPGE